MRRSLTILALLSANILYASEWKTMSVSDYESEMKQITDKLQHTTVYAVDVTYKSVEVGSSEVVRDQSSGFLKYKNKSFHSLAFGIRSIQNPKERVVVDSINKIIAVTNPISDTAQNFTPELSDLFLKKAESIERKTENGLTQYRVIFGHEFSISSYLLKVDESQLMKQIDLHYSETFKNEQGVDVSLLLRISFNNWKLNLAFPEDEFTINRYVELKDGKYKSTALYANYELSDQRVKY